MITINSLDVNGIIFTGIHLELPGENVFIIMNEIGYIMSTTFEIYVTYQKTSHHTMVAGFTKEVKTVDDLLYAPLEKITDAAKRRGWFVGMRGKDALINIA